MTPEADKIVQEMEQLVTPRPDVANATRILTELTHLLGKLRVVLAKHEEVQTEKLVRYTKALLWLTWVLVAVAIIEVVKVFVR